MSALYDFIDRNTKDLQNIAKAAQDAAMMTAYAAAGSNQFQSSSGKNYGINKEAIATVEQNRQALADRLNLTPNLDQDLAAPVVQAVEQVTKPVEQAVETVTAPVVEKVVTPVVKAVEQVTKPVEQVAQTVVQAVTPVVESVVDVAKVPVQAVEQITKIDAPKVVESVAKETILAPVKAAETVVKAAEPVAQAAAQVVQQPVKAVQEIAKIDVPKVVENVVKQAATTVTETPKMVVEIAENAVLKPASNLSMYLTEEAKDASELLWNNIIDPFQPGETQGTEGGGTDPALDANAPNPGDDKVFSDLETATGKGSQMSEEERLRRIRRLLTNRYGREKTILGGAGDTTSRRRYAV